MYDDRLTFMSLADDQAGEAMKNKLLADAVKPVKAVKVVDRSASAGGFKAYEKAFGKLVRCGRRARSQSPKALFDNSSAIDFMMWQS